MSAVQVSLRFPYPMLTFTLKSTNFIACVSLSVWLPHLRATENNCTSTIQDIGRASVRLILDRDYRNGIKLLNEANELNSEFPSPAIRGSPKYEGAAIDVSFGNQQITAMLTDRPPMKRYIENGDLLWMWTRNRFVGTRMCGPMRWDSSEPVSVSDQVPPRADAPGSIRVSKKMQTTFEPSVEMLGDKMWACVVFELFNSCYGNYYQKLVEEAMLGRIPKEEFVRGVFMIEMSAIDDTREFYSEVYLVWAEEKKALTHPANWFVDRWWGDKELLFKSCDNKNAYPWIPYGSYYDTWAKARRLFNIR